MSTRPKKSEYQAGPTETTNARVALARNNWFKKNYGPLLQNQKNFHKRNTRKMIRNRSTADVAQQTAPTSFRETMRTERGAQQGSALTGNLNVANAQANELENRVATNTVATAQGQQADASLGLSQAARIGTSNQLAKLRDDQMVSQAKWDAGTAIATAGFMRGAEEGLFGKKIQDKVKPPITIIGTTT